MVTILTACKNNNYDPPYLDPTFLNIAVSGSVVGDTVVKAGSIVEYGTYTLKSSSQYNWEVPSDARIIDGDNTNIIKVQFGLASGEVNVKAGKISGHITSIIQFSITGPVTAGTGSTLSYSTTATKLDNVSYDWQVSPGITIVSGNGTNRIEARFTGTGTKQIICTASDADVDRSDTLTVDVK